VAFRENRVRSTYEIPLSLKQRIISVAVADERLAIGKTGGSEKSTDLIFEKTKLEEALSQRTKSETFVANPNN
jgi:hypothetical protein